MPSSTNMTTTTHTETRLCLSGFYLSLCLNHISQNHPSLSLNAQLVYTDDKTCISFKTNSLRRNINTISQNIFAKNYTGGKRVELRHTGGIQLPPLISLASRRSFLLSRKLSLVESFPPDRVRTHVYTVSTNPLRRRSLSVKLRVI